MNLLHFIYVVIIIITGQTESAPTMAPLPDGPTHSNYPIIAWDCSEPIGIQDTSFEVGMDDCLLHQQRANLSKIKKEVVNFQVLHKPDQQRFDGFRCTLTRTQRAFYCGMHSHAVRDEDLTYMARPVRMTVQECRRAAFNSRWTEIGRAHV